MKSKMHDKDCLKFMYSKMCKKKKKNPSFSLRNVL